MCRCKRLDYNKKKARERERERREETGTRSKLFAVVSYNFSSLLIFQVQVNQYIQCLLFLYLFFHSFIHVLPSIVHQLSIASWGVRLLQNFLLPLLFDFNTNTTIENIPSSNSFIAIKRMNNKARKINSRFSRWWYGMVKLVSISHNFAHTQTIIATVEIYYNYYGSQKDT